MFVLVVRDRYVVRERLNRERSFGKAVWQAAMAPIFGVDSILRLGRRRRTKRTLRLLV